MKGTLQEALDSAREALKEFYEEDRLHHIECIQNAIANTGGYMNTEPISQAKADELGIGIETVSIGEERVDIVEYLPIGIDDNANSFDDIDDCDIIPRVDRSACNTCTSESCEGCQSYR